VRALKASGVDIDVHIAPDGKQALEYLSRAMPLPRLVLLEMNLSGIDGLQVLEEIRVDPRTRHLTVVIFSSSAEPRMLERARTLGADDCVRKPAQYGALRAAIGQIARRWLVAEGKPG
jgi:CheY-like chemotaxis protein